MGTRLRAAQSQAPASGWHLLSLLCHQLEVPGPSGPERRPCARNSPSRLPGWGFSGAALGQGPLHKVADVTKKLEHWGIITPNVTYL